MASACLTLRRRHLPGSVRSPTVREGTVADLLRSHSVKRLFALAELHVFDRLLELLLSPQIPGATVPAPWRHAVWEQVSLAKATRCIRFEAAHDKLWLSRGADDDMNVIGSHANRVKIILSAHANVLYCCLDRVPLILCE